MAGPDDLKILPYGFIFDQCKVLKKEPDFTSVIFPLLSAAAVLPAIDQQLAGIKGFQQTDNVQQGGLAFATFSGEAYEFAIVYFKIKTVEDGQISEPLCYIFPVIIFFLPLR